jgi:O-antigen/teichoic acid export membrane protein
MSTRKSLAYSFLDRYSGLAISVAASMVIARLLTPTDIGVFSVVMVLLMFVSTVRDMGTGQYLIQEKDLTTARIRSVWAVQLGLGFALATLVLLASYPISVFYREPRMLPIMIVVAINYAINPFGSLTYAWLMREMRFRSIALMRFSSALASAMVSVWMAWQGHGPISLAFGSLAGTAVNALMAVLFRPASFPWLPGITEVRRVLSFGSKLTGSSLLTVCASSAPELIIGKLEDLTAAGLYSRANGLLLMFNRLFVDAIGAVCLPWFAQHARASISLSEPFLKATGYITALGWSFCFFVLFTSYPLLRLLYGSQWDAAVDLTRLLAISTAFSIAASLGQTALLSVGRVNVIARVSIINALLSVAMYAIGGWFGLIGMGVAAIVSQGIGAALTLRAAKRQFNISVAQLVQVFSRSAGVSMAASIGPCLVFLYYGSFPSQYIEALALASCSVAIGFISAVFFFNHPLRQEIEAVWAKLFPVRQ